MRAVKLTEISNADISDIKIYIFGNIKKIIDKIL